MQPTFVHTSKIKPRHIAESHQRQLNGEDWQKVANDIAADIGLCSKNPEDEEDYNTLCGSPDEWCGCATCNNFSWPEYDQI